MDDNLKRKGSGRPRAIPENQIEDVVSLYKSGLGYRAVAHELEKTGLYADWSTVRRVIKKYRREEGSRDGLSSNCATILTRPLQANQGNP